MSIDTSNMVNVKDLKTSCLENIGELIELSNEAINFIKTQKWCNDIINVMFDRGCGYILGVFYFTIKPSGEGVPDHIWVIVGDIPPAYIDADDNPNGACAIDAYVIEMQKWVDNVKLGKPVDELIPVNVTPTKDNATLLQQRLNLIKEEILVNFEDEIGVV